MKKLHVFKHSLLFVFFDFVNKAIPFLMLPYLAKVLSIDDFGKLELFMTSQSFAVIFIMFSLDGWISVFYHKLSKEHFRKNLKTGLAFSVFLSTLLSAGFFIHYGQSLYCLVPIYSLFACFVQLRAILYRVEFRTFRASILLFINAALSALFTILIFEITSPSFDLRVLSMNLVAACIGLWSIHSILKDGKDSKGWGDLKTILKFSSPLIPSGLIGFVRFGGDKLIVASLATTGILAVLGVAFQLSMIANILMLSLNQAVQPFVMKSLAGKDYKNYFSITMCAIGGYTVAILFFYLTLPYVFEHLFSESYRKSLDIALDFAIVYPVVYIGINMINILFFCEKTRAILLINGIAATVHAGLIFASFIALGRIEVTLLPNVLMVSTIVYILLAFTVVRKTEVFRQTKYCVMS